MSDDQSRMNATVLMVAVAAVVVGVAAVVAAVLWFAFVPPERLGGDDEEPPIVFEPKGGGMTQDVVMAWYRCDKGDCATGKTELTGRYNFFIGDHKHLLPPAFIGGLKGGTIEATVKDTKDSSPRPVDHVCIEAMVLGTKMQAQIDFTDKSPAKPQDSHIAWEIAWDPGTFHVGNDGRAPFGNSFVPFVLAGVAPGGLRPGTCAQQLPAVHSLQFRVRP